MARVQQIIDEVERGEYVVPDFQRAFVWQPEDISDLIASILGDYHIGTLLILESPEKDALFKISPVAGVDRVDGNSMVKVILDGQQRITSLFYALSAPNVNIPFRKSPARFYLNIEKVCRGEYLTAVEHCLTSKKIQIQKWEDPKKYIPLVVFRDPKKLQDFIKKHGITDKTPELIMANVRFLQYEVNTITLKHAADLERIVETFERLNRYGRPLSTFDLVAAHLYKHKIQLKDYVDKAATDKKYSSWWPGEKKDEREVALMILKIMLLSDKKTLDRNDLLKMNPLDFKSHWKKALKALHDAHNRLKTSYGVFDEGKLLPMPPMLIPMAAMLANAKNDSDFKKIDLWYWNAVFSKRYEASANSRAVSDVVSMEKWVNSDSENDRPGFFDEYEFSNEDFENIKESSALYRGIMCAYATQGCYDFQTGQIPEFAPDRVQDDHIFPYSKYGDDNILNRTLISTNQAKNDAAPKEYFSEMEKKHGREKLLEILGTHLISRNALNALLLNDREAFKEERKRELINLQKKLVG